uniref:G-protein coupled receptors family 1 profile domain-containing protein n=1 Tax=Parascaris univalens TaxID=6257 RepID=A0A915B760_PARUN
MNISEEEQCFYAQPEFLVERFWLVTVSGTTIASISIIENLFLFLVLVTKRHHRNSHSLYLLLLAFFDVSVSGAYIPLMSLSHLVDYMHSVILLRAWFFYMIPMITISHIAMTSSSFLILSASFERYCVIAMPHRMECLNRYRCQIATAAIILGIVTKSTLAFEFSIKYQNECFDTMAEYALELSALAKDPIYNLLWRLWFRNGITILLPFFLLAFMNARTAISLHRSELIPEDMQKLSESQRKVSLLTILAGALRLPIYISCQQQLRSEFALVFRSLFGYSDSLTRRLLNLSEISIFKFEQCDEATKEETNDSIKMQPILIFNKCDAPLNNASVDDVFL